MQALCTASMLQELKASSKGGGATSEYASQHLVQIVQLHLVHDANGLRRQHKELPVNLFSVICFINKETPAASLEGTSRIA
jgi:hypothetical protein